MTDNDIFQVLIGKINFCKELTAWGTEISLTQLEDILDFVNRQKANAEGLTNAVKYLNEQLSSAKTEAVKECVEKIKSRSGKSVMTDHGIQVAGSATYWISEVTLCEIEKEMAGDTE